MYGWAEQNPSDVARQLVDASAMYVRVIGRLDGPDWNRTLVHGEKGKEVPLRWSAAQTHHELIHHTLDIRRQLGK